jgi:hypothetical protein
MKLPMIALLSTVLGLSSAVAVHSVNQLIAHHQNKHDEMRELMYGQPLEQGPGDLSQAIPIGVTPLDATPEPGYEPQPGSAMPLIQLKRDANVPRAIARPSAYLVLKKTDQLVKPTKDPIWSLELVSNDGKVLGSMPALTGRASRQTANRNTAGNKSPLPIGNYAIDRYGIAAAPFDDPELGKGYWIPVTPLFITNRSALGFHQDPSWGKTNGESGTSGCIGLESTDATVKLMTWIKQFNIQRLSVQS